MVGGTIEYVSLITGYRFLLIVVAVLYALAFVTGLGRKVGADRREVPPSTAGAAGRGR
jgi:hypothetical protein